jgi:acetylornithine/N-succinyldiaminopimelate aminotransferase
MTTTLDRLQIGRGVHMDHYGGHRLPFSCVSASGLMQTLVCLDGPDVGRKFDVTDASGGYASACLGAGHPVIATAAAKLIPQCGYTTDELGSAERDGLLADLFGPGGRWTDQFPSGAFHVAGRNSGSEGLELALRLVLESRWDPRNLRSRPEKQVRNKILAFEGAWHGWTAGCLALNNRRHYRLGLPDAVAEGPHGAAVSFIPFADPKRLEEYFRTHGAELLAVFVEPVQGDGGILVPPPGYLRRLAALCGEHGALLVADEVLTFGKTGKYFALDDDGPVPADVTVIGKSLGMGAYPVSMVIARRELAVRPSGAVATCDLRPLACGLIRAGLDEIDSAGLLRRSAELGEDLRERLRDAAAELPSVFGEVRGRGYLNGVELTETSAAALPRLRRCLLEAGVYVEFMAGAGRRSGGLRFVFPALRVAPPLIAGPSDIEHIAAAVRQGGRRFKETI